MQRENSKTDFQGLEDFGSLKNTFPQMSRAFNQRWPVSPRSSLHEKLRQVLIRHQLVIVQLSLQHVFAHQPV